MERSLYRSELRVGPLYSPRYRPGSARPTYDTDVFSGRNYEPLRADQDQASTEADRQAGNQDQQGDQPARPYEARVFGVYLKEFANRFLHHTYNYGIRDLIVRRGQEFTMNIRLVEPYKEGKDKLKLQFAIGNSPLQSKGTLVRMVVNDDPYYNPGTDTWWARIDKFEPDENNLVVTVSPSSSCIVGKYNLFVEPNQVDDKGKMHRKRYRHDDPIYILFNAWCKDDSVYMEDAEQREEFVLEEKGRVYVGHAKRGTSGIRGRPWNFGQLAKQSLECALHLLTESHLPKMVQSNPTRITRCLSYMVNNNENPKGLLCGNWSGNYYGGTHPSDWAGSVKIIEEYMATKRPVKFGQCWVFSAVTVTLCRALGIPTRSVTNFKSAHDTDGSMTIDYHMDHTGQPRDEMDDSVWNFHVWNESWFSRPDLPSGHDGWQAFDATPQESSDGLYQCGPSSIKAIKEGAVYMGYDAPFIFGEVNGDRVTWVMAEDGDLTPIHVQKDAVGKYISTKAVGSSEREDLTANYKYPEGSEEERESVKRASHHSTRCDKLRSFYNLEERQDILFMYNSNANEAGNLEMNVQMTNQSKEKRCLTVNFSGRARYYTGVPGAKVADRMFEVTLDPEESKKVTWNLKGHEYLNELDDDAELGVYIMAKVGETGQIFTAEDSFAVDKPELEVKVSKSNPKVGESFDVTVTFTNPLELHLKEMALFVEAAGIQKYKQVSVKKQSLQGGEQLQETITLTPKYPGKREVIINMRSKILVGIHGSALIEVVE